MDHLVEPGRVKQAGGRREGQGLHGADRPLADDKRPGRAFFLLTWSDSRHQTGQNQSDRRGSRKTLPGIPDEAEK